MLSFDENIIGNVKFVFFREHEAQAKQLVEEEFSLADLTHADYEQREAKSGVIVDVATIEIEEVYDPLYHDTYEFLATAQIPAVMIIKTDKGKDIITCSRVSGDSDSFRVETLKGISAYGVFNAAERIAGEAKDLEDFKRRLAAFRDEFNVDYGILIPQA